ncbi:MAG: PAS domain-containing protein [Gammaproteobacteria bacterium]|nr:PAS domain-containing protein [Gammaproteobacteria bacterium]
MSDRLLEFFGDSKLGRAMLEADQRTMESGRTIKIEEQITIRGETMSYLNIRSPFQDSTGQIGGLIGIAHDITERKRNEDKRFAQLASQRDTLVREIHHRIKNHLQGVTGLLRNRIAQRPELAEDLEAVITQIRSITYIYGLQSHTADGRVRLDELLKILVNDTATAVPIQWILPAPEPETSALLVPEEAVPLALVLNELLTNALKHNAGSRSTHSIRVTLEANVIEQRVVIRNGPAVLPTPFDFATSQGLGTGLELLRALLPPQGAMLTFRQEADAVVAELRLTPPVIASSAGKNDSLRFFKNMHAIRQQALGALPGSPTLSATPSCAPELNFGRQSLATLSQPHQTGNPTGSRQSESSSLPPAATPLQSPCSTPLDKR